MSPTHQNPVSTFCWTEVGTTDPAAAKRFWGAVLGWSFIDDPLPDGSTYTMCMAGEAAVGGLYTLPPELLAMGVPPHFMSYISVADADETARRAQALGGQVMKEPFDVMDLGRMAVLVDPLGASFAIWQARKHPGETPGEGKPGTRCWNELVTDAPERAAAFYSELFGWQAQKAPMGGMDYTLFQAGELMVGGLMQKAPEMGPMPSCWVIYFVVPDCDAAVKRAEASGGKVLMPPMDLPEVGRMTWLMDGQGAMAGILEPPPDKR